jgi:hypothetical protein
MRSSKWPLSANVAASLDDTVSNLFAGAFTDEFLLTLERGLDF